VCLIYVWGVLAGRAEACIWVDVEAWIFVDIFVGFREAAWSSVAVCLLGGSLSRWKVSKFRLSCLWPAYRLCHVLWCA
jgi:hypothetical protein